ncbi:Glutaredoxin [Microbotryomycetes sp. JL221]|nr:Glutaredoxin [Microbotryomycetes sp. JL221]
MSVKAAVNEKISGQKVVVFSKSYCPYCKKAKSLFDSLNQEYEAIELDQMEEGSDWQAYLAELTGQRTVPNIFIDGKPIGGSDDLRELHSNGKLKQLLA